MLGRFPASVLVKRLLLVACLFLLGCDEVGTAVFRNLTSETLRVQITFVKFRDAAENDELRCPLVDFFMLPNQAVGTPNAEKMARRLGRQSFLYDLKKCIVTLDLPAGNSLETGQFGKGASLWEAKLMLIHSSKGDVIFQRNEFGFHKVNPEENLFVWDYGWGS